MREKSCIIDHISAMKPLPLFDNQDEILNSKTFVAEVKYDGERYLSLFEGRNCVRYFSLHKNRVSGLNVEKTDRFPHINKIKHEIKGTVLDGEIHSKTLEDTCAITGSLPERAIKLQGKIGYVKYKVFDCLFYCGRDIRHKPYFHRRKYAKMVVEELDNDYISLSKANIQHKQKLLDNVRRIGGEGIVLKDISSTYEPGTRHKKWYKIKNEIKVDVVITDYVMGKGKHNKDKIGAIVYSAYENEKLERWGTVGGMTKAIIEEITNHPEEYLGTVIEIESQGYTKNMNLRHPRFSRFRLDKKPSECLKIKQT